MTQQNSDPPVFSDSLSEALIELTVEKFSSFVEEYAERISLSGMFLRSSDPKPVATPVSIEIKLSDGYRLIHAVGEVAWVTLDPDSAFGRGMAIRFQALDESGRELLLKIIEEQLKGGASTFEIRQIPPGAITAPGTLPAPTPAAPRQPAAGETPEPSGDGLESVLEEMVFPLPDAAAGTPTPTFDAPWGSQLPELPPEILVTDAAPVETTPPPAPLAAAGRRPPALSAEELSAIGPADGSEEESAEDSGDLAAFDIEAPPIDFPEVETQPLSPPSAGDTLPTLTRAPETTRPSPPEAHADTSFADLSEAQDRAPYDSGDDDSGGSVDFASVPVDFELPRQDLEARFAPPPADVDFGEEPVATEAAEAGSATYLDAGSASAGLVDLAMPPVPEPPASPPPTADPSETSFFDTAEAKSPPSWPEVTETVDQDLATGKNLSPPEPPPPTAELAVQETAAPEIPEPTHPGASFLESPGLEPAVSMPSEHRWPAPDDAATAPPATASSGDTVSAGTGPEVSISEDLEPLTFDPSAPPPVWRRPASLAALLLLALIAGGLYWQRDALRGLMPPSEAAAPPSKAPSEPEAIADPDSVAGAGAATDPEETEEPALEGLRNRTGPPQQARPEVPALSQQPVVPRRPATAIESITWTSTAGGTQITIRANGGLGTERLVRTRIEAPPVRELIRLTDIERPYVDSVIAVGSRELRRIRTGHHTGDELHIVLDLAGADFELGDTVELGDRLQLLVKKR